ncbi:hypothetical protein LOK49_LG07G00063 [Camellia lanceoleosa]|uniref:Uncharacterized protein n=1 Tax=Camellia lanceoleosa TaxID=1840588 RepID=A0ACC0H114_9ERIC|nr:hypothetical protein LOK49_LG07G00063 [Camellia lanceoleosa]
MPNACLKDMFLGFLLSTFFSFPFQATDGIAFLLVFVGVLLAIVPLRHLTLLVFLESFTREMPLRKANSDRWLRRIREWWVRIPAAPVLLIKADDKKRK